MAFAGEIDVRVREGSLLPGGGDGVTQLFYTQRDGLTWLIADENDNGVLDDSDFTVQFIGTHDFTQADFTRTDFVTVGTAGDDELVGTEDADRIFGAGGNDTITGLGGDDELNGGEGNDVIDGGPGGFDMLNGDGGDDTLTLATSDIGGVASGGDGNDTVFGSDVGFFSDLQGGNGDDILNAGAVSTTLSGGDGADILRSGAGDDQLNGGYNEDFTLDGDPDLFVYGAWAWGTDNVYQFDDGLDLFDLRGSGLTFADLTIVNDDFQTTITSANGTIFINEFDGPVEITADDFIFS